VPGGGGAAARVSLVPLCGTDAPDLVGLLEEPNLRGWLRSEDVRDLRERFGGWEVRRSPDGSEEWLNWVVRAADDGRALGWVQATVGEGPVLVAYATLPSERGRGFATEALEALMAELRARLSGVAFEAHIHPDNAGSERVAAAAGFSVTDRTADGERVWSAAVGAA
jgi:RimJ/RimL family protein N-acetyltransferase